MTATLPSLMRAFVCRTLTEDWSGAALDMVPVPSPRKGEALVRVAAAGVNFPDLLMCQGKYQLKPDLPFSPGMEIAGEIAALGEGDYAGFATGDRVCGGTKTGGFAEYAIAPLAGLRHKPAALDMAQASAYSAAYLTAYVALVRRGVLQKGETLLVHGAAGGVGLAAVDLGLKLGATVIATASSAEKRAFLKSYGAHHVLEANGFREAVKDLTGGRGADVIYDPVGGDVFDESVRCIAFDGRLLVIGFTSGRIPNVSANMPLIKGFSVVGVRAGEYGRQFPERGRENGEAIWKMADAGEIRPRIHARLPLENVHDAFHLLASRKVIGKVVVTP
ncbi:MAG: NADPH2:quinone reductase [Alphaproteobacteria bacterium]|nr:MAG: NADPH2:quinone reductase [Caulobacteraceae bacterium]TPW04499.1 MAG: NADPH2:quinone reductase [Alphaproteobacteria bacterium]